MSNGLQLVSSAADGLVKLWNIQEEECADSVVTFWEDCTEELELEKEEERVNLALKYVLEVFLRVHDLPARAAENKIT